MQVNGVICYVAYINIRLYGKPKTTVDFPWTEPRRYFIQFESTVIIIIVQEREELFNHTIFFKLEVQGGYLEVSQAEQEATSTDKPISNHTKNIS